MKKPIFVIGLSAIIVSGCQSSDEAALEKRVSDLQTKVALMQASMDEMETNLAVVENMVVEMKTSAINK